MTEPAQASTILNLADAELSNLSAGDKTIELAFYGGTFTALPDSILSACLDFFRRHLAYGTVIRGRCSTRPDCVSDTTLFRLRSEGLDLVELGVQSFNNQALYLAQRGYNGVTALNGCLAVIKSGLALGIQLMPGMPGVSSEIFLKDVDQALELRPACLRFYPCLVPDGTELAALWRQGRYSPWSEEETVDTLGEALRRAWKAGIPVVRLSVAPEASFDNGVLAGPRHPALGSLIQAQALLKATRAALSQQPLPPQGLSLPRSCQGYMYGDHGALRPIWDKLGLDATRVVFHTEPAGTAVFLTDDKAATCS